ncbi:hypothetical protein DWY56_04940 [Ruminococcus sp. AF25-3LB]|jgi:hypothetical protein|nr:hypothetical protein DWY56_04940 [Ruminococcus sp. AF25-3LB]RGG29668.1 hypothetical protein DWY40_04520 [Ruminococcus sp. AF25-17]
MDRLKKIGKSLLFPHIVIMIILLPIAIALLVYSMMFLSSETPIAIASYVLSAYTLVIWCVRIPQLITAIKTLKKENKYIKTWVGDVRLRMNVSLYGSFIWNVAYAVFQLCLGLYHSSFWYYSMAAYYIFLAAMRFHLSRHTRKYETGEKLREEFVRYRNCGIVFLVMNLALSLLIFFMVYWNRTFIHHEITTIAMATYTFTTFILAIINLIKYRKYNSPVYSASKIINLVAACVSMLTLTSTMLTTFGEADGILFRKTMLGALGSVISLFTITIAIYMIIRANRSLKQLGFNISET